jgi:hypothetical protein
MNPLLSEFLDKNAEVNNIDGEKEDKKDRKDDDMTPENPQKEEDSKNVNIEPDQDAQLEGENDLDETVNEIMAGDAINETVAHDEGEDSVAAATNDPEPNGKHPIEPGCPIEHQKKAAGLGLYVIRDNDDDTVTLSKATLDALMKKLLG